MDSKHILIIFVGPIAGGKTTRARALCRKYGDECYFKVISPFGGLAYLMLRFVIALLTLIHPEYRRLTSAKKAVAFLEVFFTGFFRKILPLVILLDTISLGIKALALYVVSMRRRIVVVEDFIPQIIADHIAYMHLYYPRSGLERIDMKLLYAIAMSFAKRFAQRRICAYVRPKDAKTHLRRALARREPISNVFGFYNEFLRGKLVREVCTGIGCNVVEVY